MGWRSYLRAHPVAVDGGWAVLLLILLVPVLSRSVRWSQPETSIVVAISVGLCAPLAWRRIVTVPVFGLVVTAGLLQLLLGVRGLPTDFAILIALYTVASREPLRRTVPAFVVVELGIVAGSLRWAGSVGGAVIMLTAWATAATVIGINVRTRRAYLSALEDRAARLERERDQQAQLAAAGERARIAREMHDVVAHGLSVMIAQAQGAAYIARTSTDRAVGAMQTVADTGRQALAEMRHLLGVLRDDDDPPALTPQPGAADVPTLVAQMRDAGLPVRLTTVGTPRELSPALGLTVYRLVQEALTNVIKHAGPAVAEVHQLYLPDGLRITVSDNGRGRTATATGGGLGLVGMAERAAIHGGTLVAGPAPGGGWRVSASLPIPSGADAGELGTADQHDAGIASR